MSEHPTSDPFVEKVPTAPPVQSAEAATEVPQEESALTWYAQHFLMGFSYYLPLPFTLLLLVALSVNLFGEAFGIDKLVWHGNPLKQGVVGAAMGAVWVQVLFIGYLLWLQDQRERAARERANQRPALSFTSFAGRITLCFVLTVGVLTVTWFAVESLADIFTSPATTHSAGWLALTSGRVSDRLGLPIGVVLAIGAIWALARKPLYDRAIRGVEWSRGKLTRIGVRVRRAGDGQSVRGSRRMICCGLVVWGAVLFLAWPRDPSSPAGLLRIAFLVAVFVSVLVAARSSSRAAFAWVLSAHTVLAYVVVTWALSRYNWPVGLLALAVALLALPALLYHCLPMAAENFLARAMQFYGEPVPPGPEERRWRQLAAPAILAGSAFFVLVCALPLLASPLPVICFLLFGALVLYGFLKLVIRHSLPMVLGLLLFLALLAGVQPYKFRFDPGLGYDGGVLDVAKVLPAERDRQQQFDQALRAYLESHTQHELLLNQLEHANDSDATPDQRAQANQAQTQVKKVAVILAGREQALRQKWAELEKNQVLPGRLQRQKVLALLHEGRKTGDGPLWIGDVDSWPDAEKKPLILIAVSGGGLRSAAWTLTVLQKLEAAFAEAGIPDFPAHVRLITGASGGMLGAAYYVAALEPPAQRKRGPDRLHEMDQQYDALTGDCLTSVVRQYVFGDLPSLFSPWPSGYDRGKALEDAWSANLDGKLDLTFAQLREGEQAGWRPALAFTPMMIEDGRRLIISNLDLRYPLSNDGNLLTGEASSQALLNPSENYSLDAWELFRLFPERRSSLRLSTAVRMSASFPFFSPAVSLPTKPRRRVVDAGYYDNYGVTLSAAWLFSGVHWAWIEQHVSKAVLIQIRDGVSDDQRTLQQVAPDDSTGLSRAFEDFFSPLEGLNNGRVGSASFRNDGQLELLSQFMAAKPDFTPAPDRDERLETIPPHAKRRFTVVTFEFPDQAALSWYLSDVERRRLRQGIDGDPFKKKIAQLVEWWNADVEANN